MKPISFTPTTPRLTRLFLATVLSLFAFDATAGTLPTLQSCSSISVDDLFYVRDYAAATPTSDCKATPAQISTYLGTLLIEDAINNGTTTKASSSNAIFDALALKQDAGAYLTAVTADSPLSGSGTSGSHLVLSTAGTWSGNAGTASALAANGTNCSAGNYPLGVDAAGNAETCTAISVGGVAWGDITGTLSAQTDLQTALDGKQPIDSDLTTIAGLTATTDNFIQSKGSAWASRTVAQVKTDLGLSGTNSGDQTSIVGISGTKAQFDTAVSDGNILYVGDITQYTDELAQDAIGAMVNTSLTYTDGTPLLALTSRTIGNVAFDGTANIVPETSVIVDSTDATSSFAMFDSATGNLQAKTDAGATYNATTGMATFTGITGPLTGNASTATALATARAIGGVNFDGTAAIVPQTIQMVDAGGDTTTFPLLATAATGSLQPATDAGLSYNATTDILTATGFAGPLTGAVTGNASTATALAADGSDCSAGQFPLGVSAAGASQSCTALPTTISGTANEITASAATGAVTLSLSTIVDLTSHTLRVPNSITLPASCTVGDAYMDTDATTGARWYLCESTNTWAVQGGGASYTDEQAQDAVGAMVNTSLTYTDGTPELKVTSRTIGNVAFDATANIVPETSVIVDGSDATSFLLMVDSVTGNLQHKTDPTITADPTTGTIAATTFSGALSGNATTATALAADGANCGAGNYPLGVDASGAVQNCTAIGAGTGDVTGPASSVDNEVPRFDSTTGKVIQASGVSIDDSKNLAPITNDVGALGTTSLKWADAFFASGGVINFDSGDSTITDGTDVLAFGGATSGYTFDGVVSPSTSGGTSLGSTALPWASEYIVSGGAINFNNVDVTITHASNKLSFAGATNGYNFDDSVILGHTAELTLGGGVTGGFQQYGTAAASGSHVLGMFNTTNATTAEFQFYKSGDAAIGSATVVAADEALGKMTWYGAQQTGTLATVSTAAQIRAEVDGTVTSGASGDMPGRIVFATTPDASATLTDRIILDSTGVFKPNANDGVALGTGALSFSDLFLASGAVENYNNGDVTITHSSDLLTVAGGVFKANADLTVGNGATAAGTLKLLEDTDDGSNFASFKVPALAADTVYTLPADDGTADQFLKTDGSGVLSWTTNAVSRQSFTANGTWTKPSGVKYVIIIATGGGGGGGGADSTAAGAETAAGGGSAGATGILVLDVTSIASAAVVIGTGGSAGDAAGSDGGNGNLSKVWDGSSVEYISSAGGALGKGTGSAAAAGASGYGGDGNVASSSGGGFSVLDLKAGSGQGGITDAAGGSAAGGVGGASFWGGGGVGCTITAGAISSQEATSRVKGGGAGGACSTATAGNAGSAGADGLVVFFEFK